MKKLTLLLIACFQIQFGNAQFQPLLGDSTQWCLAWNLLPVVKAPEQRFFFEYNNFKAVSDTLIDSLNYHKVFSDLATGPSGLYYGAIREDSLHEKVYFIPADSSNEILINDFSLNLNDSIYLDFTRNFFGTLLDGYYIVDSVASISIRGGNRKYIRLTNPLNPLVDGVKPHKLVWIESVGEIHNPFYLFATDQPTYGPLTYSCNNFIETSVMKHSIDTSVNYVDMCAVTYIYATVYTDTCTLGYWGGIQENIFSLIDLSVYPNPSNGTSINVYLNNEINAKALTLVIVNTAGEVIQQVNPKLESNTIQLNLKNVENGIYNVLLYNEKRVIGVERFVVNK